MVLRQMGSGECHVTVTRCSFDCHVRLPGPAERKERVRESVERAKEAVAEDVTDGTSWSEEQNAITKCADIASMTVQ